MKITRLKLGYRVTLGDRVLHVYRNSYNRAYAGTDREWEAREGNEIVATARTFTELKLHVANLA